MKASKLTERSTVISVESENSGTHWEVKVATDDGSEHETLINISDGNVVRGPDKKDTDAEDLAENRALLDGAEIDFKEAAELLRKQVPGGTVTELNLDDYLGKIVWEGDVHDSSGVKHELKIDAASGSAFSS